MGVGRGIAATFALAFIIAACARPQDKTITEFADSTKALTTVAKSIGELNSELDYQKNVQDAAASYAIDGKLSFPPSKGRFLLGKSDDKNWKAVVGFLSAVSAYAEALAKANDPSLVTGLTGELPGIGDAAAKLAEAQGASKQSQAQITAISGVIVDIVKIATDLYAKHQVHEAIATVQPILEKARAPLLSAISAVQIVNRTRAAGYLGALNYRLKETGCLPDQAQVARQGAEKANQDAKVACPLNASQLYDQYLKRAADYAAVAAKVEALDDVAKALTDMIDAHKALLDDGDKNAAFIAFLASVSSIIEKVEKAKTASKVSD